MQSPPPLPAEPRRPKAASEILAVNLSVPGLGTIQAGCKVVGWCQLIMALIGLLMTAYFAGWFLLEWKMTGRFPLAPTTPAGSIPESWIAPIWLGVGGVVVFLMALGWSVVSSLALRKNQERR